MQRQAAGPLLQPSQHVVSRHVLCCRVEKRHKQSHLLLSSTWQSTAACSAPPGLMGRAAVMCRS